MTKSFRHLLITAKSSTPKNIMVITYFVIDKKVSATQNELLA